LAHSGGPGGIGVGADLKRRVVSPGMRGHLAEILRLNAPFIRPARKL